MRRMFAEAVGTFALVFAGCGAIVVNDVSGGEVTHVGVALTFGMVVMCMVYAVGNVSGAHLNPAVTIGFWAARRMPLRRVPPHVAAQLAEALGAAGLLRLLFPTHPTLGASLPVEALGVGRVLAIEAVLTFLLMFVILHVSTGAMEKGVMAGVAVGGMVGLAALFAGPVCGASMNPARSLGPTVVAWRLEHPWVYLTGTVLGALAASPTCRWLQGPECCPPGEAGQDA